MPIVVVAKPEAEYREWVAERQQAQAVERAATARQWSKGELMARGETVYSSSCAACHQFDGSGVPSVFPPIKDSPVATGEMDQHLDVVMKGREGTQMKAYMDRLSDLELAAVVTYQRNAFGNETGDSIQPSEIAAARQF